MKRVRGQGLIEYLILVCLVAVAAIAVVSTVGQNIREQYANISASLRGGDAVKVSAPDRAAFGGRGLDDFMEGAKKPSAGFSGWGR